MIASRVSSLRTKIGVSPFFLHCWPRWLPGMSLSYSLFAEGRLPESITKQALDNSLSETGIAIRFSESVYLFRSPGTCYSGPSESVKQSVHRFR
jgi:hypothetical protein